MYEKKIYFSLESSELKFQWDEFIKNHAVGNYFQTSSYFEFLCKQKKYFPFCIIIYSEKKIVGLLVGTRQVFGPVLFSNILNRIIVYGGPIVKNNDEVVTALILDVLNLQKSTYTEIRNFISIESHKKLFEKKGFNYLEHLNIIVKIDSNSFENIKNDKKRQIKKALKNGATIKEISNKTELSDLYLILSKLYTKKVKKPLPSYKFFEDLYSFDSCDNPSKFFIVKLNEKVIGGIVCLTYNNEVIYEYYIAGLDSEYKEYYPSVLATYAPINYGMENNYKYFDFLGAGKPDQDYGVRKFKSRFNGTEVNFGRFVKKNNLYYLIEFIFNVFRK